MSDPKPPQEFPVFFYPSFYGVRDRPGFTERLNEMLDKQYRRRAYYVGDNLITLGKSLGFLDDAALINAWKAHSETPGEFGALWRRVVLAWAARSSLRLEGDFVECGCYRGTGARIIADVVDFSKQDRRYFLYDLFDRDPERPYHSMDAHGPDLFDRVQGRFKDFPNVIVTPGLVPETFKVAAPEKIAFLHLDLNNRDAEIAALDFLFDRITPGGVIVLDDYAWIYYRDQMTAESKWFADRGYHVLELPTGQGLVIK
jgi:hypothetical protein